MFSGIIRQNFNYIQFNYTHFCVKMIFLLQLKTSMDENFLHRLFPDFFQKLFFADPLKYSLTFADFPDLVETLFTFLSKHLLFFPYQLPHSSSDSHIAFLRKENTAPNSLQCKWIAPMRSDDNGRG